MSLNSRVDSTAGFGGFAGRDFKKDDVIMRSSALFLPKNLPPGLSPWHYVFHHNGTHEALPLGYGALLNHHDSSNTKAVVPVGENDMYFRVRGSTCIHRCMRTSIHAYVHRNTKYIFKATKDIAAGQEIFYRYGSEHWFKYKNIPYSVVDSASTRWRPDLHPLPCRKKVAHTIGSDHQHSYAVLEAVASDTVLEISLCLEMPLIVVDQFPFLWDYVLTGETKNVRDG